MPNIMSSRFIGITLMTGREFLALIETGPEAPYGRFEVKTTE
jgi:hypothetical protein